MQNDPSFEDFWSQFPKKVAKKDAQKAWARMTAGEKALAVAAIPKHAERWDDPAYIPHPASWLRGERWTDEIQHFGPTPKKVETAWWTTHEGVERKGREMGMQAKSGESWAQFKDRVITADSINRKLRAA